MLTVQSTKKLNHIFTTLSSPAAPRLRQGTTDSQRSDNPKVCRSACVDLQLKNSDYFLDRGERFFFALAFAIALQAPGTLPDHRVYMVPPHRRDAAPTPD
jgi:hypothetical protein